ncbi:MAG: glycosyltransferase, partial [Bacteroidota bacterium]
FNWILRFYLETKFSDGMCGFKFLRRSILPTLMENGAENDGWFFSTELLAVAEWHNYRLFELPVKWTDDAGSSKVNIPRLARRYLASMQVLKKRKPKARISHY